MKLKSLLIAIAVLGILWCVASNAQIQPAGTNSAPVVSAASSGTIDDIAKVLGDFGIHVTAAGIVPALTCIFLIARLLLKYTGLGKTPFGSFLAHLALNIPNKVPVILFAVMLSFFAVGCAGNKPNLNSPPPAHIVHVNANVKQLGIANNTSTGDETLGYQAGMADVATIPCQLVVGTGTNSAGGITNTLKFVTPNVAISYEVNGSSSVFGHAGSTYTFATGDEAVKTLLGGSHYPVNYPTNFWPPVVVITTNAPAK